MSDATARRHDVLRAAMTLDDQLDDIKRAQIWSQLEDRLAEPAPARRRWPIATAAAAVLAAAALALVWLRPHRPSAHTLSAPAETTLATSLGPHARAELVGPASLELVGTPGEATSVRLHTGTLLAEFTGGPGRSLRVETPQAVVEIVGTLFTVEAREGSTCVSVAHGKVRVTTRAATIAVAGGESWCSTRTDVTPIEPAAHERLARFAAVMTARAEVPPAAPEPPVPAPTVVSVPLPTVASVPAPPTPEMPAPTHATPTPKRVAAIAAQTAPDVTAAMPAPATPPVIAELPAPPPPPTAAPTPIPPAATATAPSSAIVSTEAPSPQEAAPASPPPAPPVAAAPTPESLYEAAEAALARRDAAGADRILARIVAEFPHASLVDQALFERARIAYDRHAWRDAQQRLDELAAIASTPLAEPGAYLACRIALEARDGAAERCLTDYRKAYPRSPHDLDVLGVLTDLAYRDGGCARARPRIDELVRAYQRTTLARAWLDRCPEGR